MNDFLRKMSEIGRIEVERQDGGPQLQVLDEEAEAALLLGCQRSITHWQIRVARWLYAAVAVGIAVGIVTAGSGGAWLLAIAAALVAHAALVIRAPGWRAWGRPAAAYAAALAAATIEGGPEGFGAMLMIPAAAVAVAAAGWWATGYVLEMWYQWKIEAAGVDISVREQPAVQRGTQIEDWRE